MDFDAKDMKYKPSSWNYCKADTNSTKDMKLEVTNDKCSSKIVSILVDGECIISCFLNVRPGSVLTTHINDTVKVIG